MAGLVTLPDGQAVRAEDVAAVKTEEFVGGTWYVYVELHKHPRVTIKADDEADTKRIAAEITEAVNQTH
jgi:hypothetical protein